MVPVNGFGSASFMDKAIHVAGTPYSSLCDSLGVSYCYSTGVISVLHCSIAASCIHTLLGAIFSIKTDK